MDNELFAILITVSILLYVILMDGMFLYHKIKNKINKIENDRQKTKYIRDEQSENTLSRVSVLEEQYKNIEKLDIKVDKLTDVVTDIRLKNAEKQLLKLQFFKFFIYKY